MKNSDFNRLCSLNQKVEWLNSLIKEFAEPKETDTNIKTIKFKAYIIDTPKDHNIGGSVTQEVLVPEECTKEIIDIVKKWSQKLTEEYDNITIVDKNGKK